MAKKKAKPELTTPSAGSDNVPPFFCRDDGTADRCCICVRLDPNVAPLLHPAILVPSRPIGTTFTDGSGKKLVRWKFEFMKYCVRHARDVLSGLQDNELEAKCHDERD